MLLKVFFLLSAPLLLANMLLSLLMLLLAPMHLLVFLRLLALLLLALLHYECYSMMSLLLLFFPSPCRKSLPDSSGPWKEVFCIPQCREFLVPGARQGLPPEARLYGMEEFKMSHSRDQTTFPAFGNAKGLLPGTRRISALGNVNKIYGWREKFPGISSWIVNPWQWNFLVES